MVQFSPIPILYSNDVKAYHISHTHPPMPSRSAKEIHVKTFIFPLVNTLIFGALFFVVRGRGDLLDSHADCGHTITFLAEGGCGGSHVGVVIRQHGSPDALGLAPGRRRGVSCEFGSEIQKCPVRHGTRHGPAVPPMLTDRCQGQSTCGAGNGATRDCLVTRGCAPCVQKSAHRWLPVRSLRGLAAAGPRSLEVPVSPARPGHRVCWPTLSRQVRKRCTLPEQCALVERVASDGFLVVWAILDLNQ